MAGAWDATCPELRSIPPTMQAQGLFGIGKTAPQFVNIGSGWTSQALTDILGWSLITGGGPMGYRWKSQHVRLKYNFINAHRREFDTAVVCRLLSVSRSGFYAWL